MNRKAIRYNQPMLMSTNNASCLILFSSLIKNSFELEKIDIKTQFRI